MDTTGQRPVPAALPKLTKALRLLFSGDAGIVTQPPYVLSESELRIGRSLDGPGLVLSDDRQVSRLHATIFSGAQGLFILDEGSKNGTFVNGQRVPARDASAGNVTPGALLKNGDVIRIGDSFLLLRDEPVVPSDANITELFGRSPAMRSLRHTIKQVAKTSAMVLLLGESGSGKEVAARAVHALSERSGPFVAVNCSAIPESLAESQLFGHLRGAFTGASQQPGLFRAAHGGTLFLDEVGELSLALQPKLLRALEEKAVLPVGATQPVPCDVRIVAATNRNLGPAVQNGQFRGDLLARLAEFMLVLPPLRERREDILFLAERAFREGGQELPRLHPDLVERLLLYSWPFNVRELYKTVSELRIRGANLPILGPDLIADRLTLTAEAALPLSARIEEVFPPCLAPPPRQAPEKTRERSFARGPIPSADELEEKLKKHKGIVSDIAKAMQRSRAQVYRWLEQRGLDPHKYRG